MELPTKEGKGRRMEQLNLRIGDHVDRILDATPEVLALPLAIPDENLVDLIQSTFEQLDGGRPLVAPDEMKCIELDHEDWLQLLDLIREWSRMTQDPGISQYEEKEISHMGKGILWASVLIREYQKRTGKSFMS